LQQQGGAVETIVGNMRTLESKLAEAKMKKDTLKARAQSAKSARAISDMVGGLSTGSALSAFEKMEEKVLSLEAEADAATMVSILQLYEKLLFCLLISAQINANYIIIAAFCSR
jgi:phage shock protein A